MSANDQLTSGATTLNVPPGRDRRRNHRAHRHHHKRHRLRRKLKIGVLIGLGLVVALLAWYFVVAYLDERALGATLRRLAEVFGVRS